MQAIISSYFLTPNKFVPHRFLFCRADHWLLSPRMHRHWIRIPNLRTLHCFATSWDPIHRYRCASRNSNFHHWNAWLRIKNLLFVGISRRNCNSDQRRSRVKKICYSFKSGWRYPGSWSHRRGPTYGSGECFVGSCYVSPKVLGNR